MEQQTLDLSVETETLLIQLSKQAVSTVAKKRGWPKKDAAKAWRPKS